MAARQGAHANLVKTVPHQGCHASSSVLQIASAKTSPRTKASVPPVPSVQTSGDPLYPPPSCGRRNRCVGPKVEPIADPEFVLTTMQAAIAHSSHRSE